MGHSKKVTKQSCQINRREFCKRIPCAAVGAIFSTSLIGMTLKGDTTIPSSKESNYKKEEIMAKKITAVTAKVISQKGTCALGHKIGHKVKFTESGVEGKICIHALYSMLPGGFGMMYESRFPWLKDPDKKTHACPDAYSPVVFEIERIREK